MLFGSVYYKLISAIFFLDETGTTPISGTVATLNLPQKSVPSSRLVH